MHPREDHRQRSSGSTVAVTALIVGAVVIVAGIVGGTLLLLDDETPTPAATPTAMSPSPSVSVPETQAEVIEKPSPPSSSAETGPGDVADLPDGLFCRDLMADEYSYSAAVTYWREAGQPNRMDEDRNGIPCQTVYSPADVSSYWGDAAVPGDLVSPVESLPSGLFCRDLLGQGYTYEEAVAYWFSWNLPDQMDADLNGIPCETVYLRSDVDTYWYG